jgi:hypothetical protein
LIVDLLEEVERYRKSLRAPGTANALATTEFDLFGSEGCA